MQLNQEDIDRPLGNPFAGDDVVKTYTTTVVNTISPSSRASGRNGSGSESVSVSADVATVEVKTDTDAVGVEEDVDLMID